MYEMLISALRNCQESLCGECKYKSLSKPGNFVPCMNKMIENAADAIEDLQRCLDAVSADNDNLCQRIEELSKTHWIPVTKWLPECDLGTEVGNIEWISCGMVHAGCFGRGGKYRDAYFRTWTDAGEGIDAKEADYWRAVTLPEPPKEES